MLLLIFSLFCYVGSVLLNFEKFFMGTIMHSFWYYFCLSPAKMFDYDVHFCLPELQYTCTIRKKELQERGVLLHLDCLLLTWQSHQLGTG
jgi:hypothetical protein